MSPSNDILLRGKTGLSFSARNSESTLRSSELTDYPTGTFVERSETRNSQTHETGDVS